MLRRFPLIFLVLLLQGCWLDFESAAPLIPAAEAAHPFPDRFRASPVEKTGSGAPDFTRVASAKESLEGTYEDGVYRLVETKETGKEPAGDLRMKALRAPYFLLQLSEKPGTYKYYIGRFNHTLAPGQAVFEILDLENLATEIAASPAVKAVPVAATTQYSEKGKPIRFIVRDTRFFDGILDIIDRNPDRLDGKSILYVVIHPL